MNASYLADKFAAALPYDRYVRTGTEEQQRRWRQVYEAARLTPAQAELVGRFGRDMKVLIVSGIWCGDCVQQCPLLQRCAEANPGRVDLRLLDRDEHRDLAHLNFGDGVAGLPPALPGSKPPGVPHTPWRLLEHLRIAQWDILEFCRDPKHVSPPFPDGYWPEGDAPPSEEAWDRSVEAF